MSFKIDTEFDKFLNVEYDLIKFTYKELQSTAKEWYKGIDLDKFDNRIKRPEDNVDYLVMKYSGLISNYFYAYEEDGKFYLLDGFNRLFTHYGNIDVDGIVYLKLIKTKLSDHKIMKLILMLNLWKLKTHKIDSFNVTDFFDRGVNLLLSAKFDINLYNTRNLPYNESLKSDSDAKTLDKYFTRETSYSDYYKFSYSEIIILLSHENVINDFKEIVKINTFNKYKDKHLFKNYNMFVDGFIMYLAYLRLKGYSNSINFNFFLEKLKEDKKFYKKLPTMAGNESTRKNIYNFYRSFDNELLKK